ncbi:hypothetical protein HZA97_00490 [Candidatus Woesearchaeota archaeon]|nr:hypothetical protein [Candidatus Woesearchaeota archaeon]
MKKSNISLATILLACSTLGCTSGCRITVGNKALNLGYYSHKSISSDYLVDEVSLQEIDSDSLKFERKQEDTYFFLINGEEHGVKLGDEINENGLYFSFKQEEQNGLYRIILRQNN